MKDKSDVGWCLETGWGDVCCGDDQRFARNVILKQIYVVYSVKKSQSKGKYSCSAIIKSEFLSALSWLVADFFFGWSTKVQQKFTEFVLVKSLLSTPPQLQQNYSQVGFKISQNLVSSLSFQENMGCMACKGQP